jgi:hypothetical protein
LSSNLDAVLSAAPRHSSKIAPYIFHFLFFLKRRYNERILVVGQMCEVLGKEYAKVLSVNELQRKGTGKQHFLLTT